MNSPTVYWKRVYSPVLSCGATLRTRRKRLPRLRCVNRVAVIFTALTAISAAHTMPNKRVAISRDAESSTQRSSPAQIARTLGAGQQKAAYGDLRTRAWKMLETAAASTKVRGRSDALSAMSILKANSHAVSLMSDGLSDKDEGVRTLAANSLGDMESQSAIPALRKAMDDPSPVVSFAAAKSLWKLGDHSGREMFYEVLAGRRKTQNGFVKSHVNEVKKDIHDPKTLALIGINQASGQFLGPFSMGVSMVEEYAKNTSSPVQALCANLLSQDDSTDTIEQLSMALGNNNWTVRAAAAKALANMHDLKVIPKLDEMMSSDKESAVRLAAAAAILKLTD